MMAKTSQKDWCLAAMIEGPAGTCSTPVIFERTPPTCSSSQTLERAQFLTTHQPVASEPKNISGPSTIIWTIRLT